MSIGDLRVDGVLSTILEQDPSLFHPSCQAADAQYLLRWLEQKRFEITYRTKGLKRGKRRVEIRYEDMLVGSDEAQTFELALSRAAVCGLIGHAPGEEDVESMRREAIKRLYGLCGQKLSCDDFVATISEVLRDL